MVSVSVVVSGVGDWSGGDDGASDDAGSSVVASSVTSVGVSVVGANRFGFNFSGLGGGDEEGSSKCEFHFFSLRVNLNCQKSLCL